MKHRLIRVKANRSSAVVCQQIKGFRRTAYPLDVTASSISAGGNTTKPQFERDSANGLSTQPTTPYHNYEQFQ